MAEKMRKGILICKVSVTGQCYQGENFQNIISGARHSQPAAKALNLVPHGTQNVLKLFAIFTSATLLLVYANLVLRFLKKLVVLAVAMT
jgi:hypothetical protein